MILIMRFLTLLFILTAITGMVSMFLNHENIVKLAMILIPLEVITICIVGWMVNET